MWQVSDDDGLTWMDVAGDEAPDADMIAGMTDMGDCWLWCDLLYRCL